MFTLRNEGIILEKSDLPFEDQAVLNPATIEVDGVIHMFYRAVRQGNHSTIGYCQLKGNEIIYRNEEPLLYPEEKYEKQGLEDPRILKHEDGKYYLFYTAFDGMNARIAYATSHDLKSFHKHGPITPAITFEQVREYFKDLPLKQKYIYYGLQSKYGSNPGGADTILWEKDGFLFPKKINGKYVFVHRIMPSIQIIYCDSLHQLQSEDFWNEYYSEIHHSTILDPRPGDAYVGGGCPPVETPQGWLFVYHRVIETNKVKMYCAGAALLDLNNPTKVISKLKDPFFYPQEEWELKGDINNVVFPTGTIVKDGRLFIYYGAADKVIGAKSVMLDELLTALKDKNYSEVYE